MAPTSPTTVLAPLPAFLANGPRDRSEVALTFHVSGDPVLAGQLLDVLERRGVLITAFIVGAWLADHADVADRLLGLGHELANHTLSHLTFAALAPGRMAAEVAGCRELLVRMAGTPGAWFRPSGTDNGVDLPSSAVLGAAQAGGYPVVVGYDVDPKDFDDPGADLVAHRTLDGVEPGSIVSLHFGHVGTVRAMPSILDGLAARGLAPVTVSTLLRP